MHTSILGYCMLLWSVRIARVHVQVGVAVDLWNNLDLPSYASYSS